MNSKMYKHLRAYNNFVFPTYVGGDHFEFLSEKNWGVEQDDCKIFDSIDIPHLADSIASVPFNSRHNIPDELFTVCFVTHTNVLPYSVFKLIIRFNFR